MGKKTKRSAEMGRMVQEYEKSGLTRRDFCAHRGVPITTLDYWRREGRPKPAMVRVEVAATEAGPGFMLSLANGRRIESSWRFVDGELSRLIRIAESA